MLLYRNLLRLADGLWWSIRYHELYIGFDFRKRSKHHPGNGYHYTYYDGPWNYFWWGPFYVNWMGPYLNDEGG